MASRPDYSRWSREQLIKHIEKLERKTDGPSEPSPSTSDSPVQTPKSKKKKEMDFSKYSTRKIALRFAYLGWDYNGLAVQTNIQDGVTIRTIENEIINALHKTKLIPSQDVSDCEFSRCGRTDRGVSALRQVISLRVRSNLSPEEQADPNNDEKELDYLHILNNLIPSDIRIYEICLRPPPEFDARFSCLSRHYRYFFNGKDLDIPRMDQAAKSFLGEHDFRNFCKVDASKQITNFRRTILHSTIVAHPQVPDLYFFDLKGTAFLWHQVRSMIAVLLMVGQGHEDVSIISQLLDVNATPRRPVYEMAADYPLVLWDCEFPEMEWTSFRNKETMDRVLDRTYDLWYEQWLRSSLLTEFKSLVDTNSTFQQDKQGKGSNKVFINMGSGRGKPMAKYPKLTTRPTLDTPEEINQRWLDKK